MNDNPYESPTSSSRQSSTHAVCDGSKRLTFDTVVELNDLKAPTRFLSVAIWIFVVVCGVFFAFWGTFVCALPFIFTASLALLRFLRSKNGNRVSRMNPQVLGKCRGYVSETRFFIQQDGVESEYSLDALTHFEALPNRFVLNFSAHRHLFYVIPKRAFENGDVDAAQEILKNYHRSNPKITPCVFDSRFGEDPDYSMDQPSEEACVFEGPVFMSDLRELKSLKRIRRNLLLVLGCWLIVFFTILLINLLAVLWIPVMQGDPFEWLLKAFILGPPIFLAGFGLVRMLPSLILLWRKSTLVFHTRGWLDQQGLTLIFSLGKERYDWSHFVNCEHTSTGLSVAVPGKPSRYLLFAKSQFSSEDAWADARQLCEQKISGGTTSRN